MTTKSAPVNNNVNNNTNNVNVNVHVKPPRKKTVKKESTPNWYTKAIVGGTIAIVVSISVYYINKNLDAKGAPGTTNIEHNQKPIEGIKQN